MGQPNSNESARPTSRWPHRLAWALACTTLALILAGGTVTSYQAGMAVPDWPTTYQRWFYPLNLWLNTWDVFLEHGHRMLAQVVGLLALALAGALWVLDRRKSMRYLAVALVIGVVLQGVLGGLRVVGHKVVAWLEQVAGPGLGGLRVIGDDVLLAKAHGCTGPLLFALCAALVTWTSRRWIQADQPRAYQAIEGVPRRASERPTRRLHLVALGALAAIYLQIVFGVQLRHVRPDSGPGWFVLWVWLKLTTAGLIAVGLVWLLTLVRRRPRSERMLVRRARLLVALFVVQVVLGAGAWVTKYGWPKWFTGYIWAPKYTVLQEGRLQVWLTTSHAAVGSLTLAAALSLTLWSLRLLRGAGR